MNSTSSSAARLQSLQQTLHAAKCDACLIENPLDLFYFTGLQLSSGKLIIYKSGAQLLVDGRYFQVASEKAPMPAVLENGESLRSILEIHSIKTVAFDGNHTPYDRFLQLSKYPGVTWTPATHLFKALRLIKDAHEIEKMKKSAALVWKGYQWILSALKTGITEKELARNFEIFCLQMRADALAFDPIIAFGENGAMPHYHPQDVPLQEGDAVLIDIGVVLDHYHSDMTRVTFYKSEGSSTEALYTIVKRAQKKALELCRPGVKLGTLDAAVRQVFRDENVEPLYVHSLGHGIGLQTHEFPRIKYDNDDKDLILEPGMVFTVEPGLYRPGVGGVRYEDTIVITKDGYENFFPEEE